MDEKDTQPTENAAKEDKATQPETDEFTKKLAETEQQVAQYKDLLLRKAAEFENYKKRIENESAAIVRFANEDLITEILPVLDDLERSLKSAREHKNTDVLYRGIELIHQKLLKTLQGQGLKSFETVGKEFDVHYHDALMQAQRNDVPPHTILEEVEKGYMLNDKVIRHAKVVVSAAPHEQPGPRHEEKQPGDDHQDSSKD
ncbi:MAG: nucleotide exchange factor GrpE [Ignavibacteriales bacterium]|nr:nucleotide exchange factor GrpE [Ignavibacteriales bacterium]